MATPLLRYSQAAEEVRRYVDASLNGAALAVETIPLSSAAGRILAEPIHADRDQPPFPRSTRDGFACHASDANTHAFLRLAGQIHAGQDPSAIGSGWVGSGEVWEIMTGAPVPAGADAVFMVEHAQYAVSVDAAEFHSAVYDPATRFVRLPAARTASPGDNIVPAGSEARGGDLLVPAGTRLGAAHIALAAQCGCAQLAVYARPRVAILATGDELVSVEATPGPSQIRNSNAPMLAAMVSAAGGEPMILPTARDAEESLTEALGRALDADLLLISGGISAGRFDLVDDALARAGAGFLFRGVAMQPGKPIAFGQIPREGGQPLPFFALPGNPVSSAVTFQLFAAPVLAALGGDFAREPRFAQAQLTAPWRGKAGLTRFLPARCDFSLAPRVALVSWQGSGDLAAFARANCFVVIADDVEEIGGDASIQILLVD
jgi:molybdopterin molybdotransferase